MTESHVQYLKTQVADPVEDRRPEAQGNKETMTTNPKPNVLVVDDDEHTGRLLRRILEKGGYEVTYEKDPERALNLLAGREFDVLISDIRMPGINGVDLLRRTREFDSDIPVILVTADPATDSAIQAIEYGVIRYLSKPVDRTQLLEVAAYACRLKDFARIKRDALLLQRAEEESRSLIEKRKQLARALSTIRVHFQPIFRHGSGAHPSVYAWEALARTDEPGFSSILDILELGKRINRSWEVGQALRRVTALTLEMNEINETIFVNIDPSELMDPDLCSPLAPLSKHAHRIVLEITEHTSLDRIKNLSERIQALRQMGYRIALDDVGSENSGLSKFLQVCPNVVKLDRSLVSSIDENPVKQTIVGSLHTLYTELGMGVVAEGIETSAEMDTVLRLGVVLTQGFFCGKPMPPSEAVSFTPGRGPAAMRIPKRAERGKRFSSMG